MHGAMIKIEICVLLLLKMSLLQDFTAQFQCTHCIALKRHQIKRCFNILCLV